MESAKSTNNEGLEATITYLEGLPTGTSTDSAIDNIASWEEKLRAADKPEWNTIADELSNLKSLLHSGNMDGKAISNSLLHLGELTIQSATSADQSIAGNLKKLGGCLTKLGQTLR